MFVESWNLEIFIASITKSCILTISPIINLILFIKNYAEIATCGYPLDIVPFQGFYFSWFWNNFGDFTTMPCGAYRIDK